MKLAKFTAATLAPVLAMLFASALSAQDVVAADAAANAAATTPAVPATSVPAATLRVHYHRAKNDTANWGVYSWQGPKNPSKTWITDRFMFEASDAFGGYVDIAMDSAKSEMRFLVSNAQGHKNCGNDQSLKLAPDLASKGQEIWVLESDCTIHLSAPAL